MRAKFKSIVLDSTETSSVFAQSGHALQQQVPPGKQGNQRALHHDILTYNHLPHSCADIGDEFMDAGIQCGCRRRLGWSGLIHGAALSTGFIAVW